MQDPKAPHTAALSFNFGKPFAGQPTISNGINSVGSVYAVAGYKCSATSAEYKGRLNNMYIKNPIGGSVTMQTIAVGRAI